MGAVRVTQKSKWVLPSYKRYAAFKERIRIEANRVGVPRDLPRDSIVRVALSVSWRLRARCDLDNLIKSILDGLWRNDRRVLRLSAGAEEQTGFEGMTVEIEVIE